MDPETKEQMQEAVDQWREGLFGTSELVVVLDKIRAEGNLSNTMVTDAERKKGIQPFILLDRLILGPVEHLIDQLGLDRKRKL